MPENPVCQICAAADPAPFLTHRGMEIVRCRRCGFTWLHPLPTAATVAAMYTDAYAGTTEGYFSKVDKKLRRSRARARMLAGLMPKRASRPRLLDVGASGGFLVEAAREADLPVVMVRRPLPEPGERVESVADAVDWIAARL